MSVLKPWTPVVTQKTDDGFEVSVLNRKYTLSEKSPFFSSVISCGEELLSSPMRIVAENKGIPCEFCKTKNYMMATSNDERVDLVSTMESKYVIVNVSHGIEFDGCDEITLSVMPTGASVAAVFGLEKYEMDGFDLNKLYLEIPLNKNILKYYNFFPETYQEIFNNPDEADEYFGRKPFFNSNGVIPQSGLHLPYLNQIYLNGHEKGIGFFFQSDEHFEIEDNTRVFEIINNGDELVLRLRFFDKTPAFWQDKGKDNMGSRDLCPITFKFGMQVTPVKTMDKRPHKERNFHIDCFTKIDRQTPYDVFFSNPVIDGDTEIGFDRIKRLGVDTLYIHEKWNDIQNSYELTSETSERLKLIIRECHKRGIKVVPYFGYEISTLSTIYHKTGNKYVFRKVKDNKPFYHSGSWYRYPYQRDMKACYCGDFGDIFAEGIIALQKEYGFDGFYFDGTANPYSCANLEHGCGYVDSDGNLHPNARQFEIRKMFKKIYKYASENDLILQVHSHIYPMCYCGFYDHTWMGEDIQPAFLNKQIDRVPEGLMMSRTAARDIGVPTYTLCYSNENWPFESACGVSLLYGSRPKPVDIKSPLEYMSKIWKVFDEFPMENAEFLPYYNGNNSVLSDSEDVRVSVYETDNKILAICSSIDTRVDADVTISGKFNKVTDAFDGTQLSDNGRCVIHFNGIQSKILIFENCSK